MFPCALISRVARENIKYECLIVSHYYIQVQKTIQAIVFLIACICLLARFAHGCLFPDNLSILLNEFSNYLRVNFFT